MKKIKIPLIIIILTFKIIACIGQDYFYNMNKPYPELAHYLESHSFGYNYDSISVNRVLDRQLNLIQDSTVLHALKEINYNFDATEEVLKIYYCGRYFNIFPQNFNMHVVLFQYRWPLNFDGSNSPYRYEVVIFNVCKNSKKVISLIPASSFDNALHDFIIESWSYTTIPISEKYEIHFNFLQRLGSNFSQEDLNQIIKDKTFILNENGQVKELK